MKFSGIILMIVCHVSNAQFIEFGAGIGMTQYSGDLEYGYKLNTAKPALNIHYRMNFSEIVSTRFNLVYGGIRGNDNTPVDILGQNRGRSFDNTVFELSSVIEYHFLDYKNHSLPQKWSPYTFLGFGIARLKDPSNTGQDLSKNQPVLPMGIGIKYKIGKQFVIEVEGGARKTFFDLLDGVSDGDTTVKNYQYGNPNDDDWYFFTGVRLSFVLYNIPCPFPYVPNKSLFNNR